MILRVLFIQRKESYDGEFAPEAMAVATEYVDSENPTYMNDQYDSIRGGDIVEDGISAKRIVDIEVDQDKIRELLIGKPVIRGKIVPSDE